MRGCILYFINNIDEKQGLNKRAKKRKKHMGSISAWFDLAAKVGNIDGRILYTMMRCNVLT